MVIIPGMDQPNLFVFFLYTDPISWCKFKFNITIAGQTGVIDLTRTNDDFNQTVSINDDRPVG